MAFDKSGIAFPITLDVKKDNSGVGFVVGQYDKDSKYLEISLTDDGLDYTIPVGATASLNGTKPISSNIFIDAITIEDNKLYIYLTEQACLMNGYFPVDITLYSGTKVIKIPYFMMTVTKAAVSSDAVVSADEVNVLNALILEASAVISDGNDLIDSMTTLEGTVDSNEDARLTAEGLRVTAESNRVSVELLRVSAESGRANAESDRVIAELARVNAEIARASAEVLRQDAITGETYRIANESDRVLNEDARNTFYNAYRDVVTYNASTAYILANKVTYLGGCYQCITQTTGNAPSYNTNNTWWICIAAKGSDGAGTGAGGDVMSDGSIPMAKLTVGTRKTGSTEGEMSVSIGADNDVSAPASLVIGSGNLVNGMVDSVVGTNNFSVMNSMGNIIGNDNFSFHGDLYEITSYENISHTFEIVLIYPTVATETLLIGDEIYITQSSIHTPVIKTEITNISGNIITTSYTDDFSQLTYAMRCDSEINSGHFLFGNDNISNGGNSLGIGNIVADRSTSIGEGNKIINEYVQALGKGLESARDNSILMGQYNFPRTGDLFEFGNGTDDNNRSNAIELTDTGTLKVAGDFVAGDGSSFEGIKTINAETVGSGVLYNSGLSVTAQSTPNMTVAISTGTAYMPTGERALISAVASQTITTADATNPRKDIIYVNSSNVTSYLAGTASATPVAPSLPSGGVLLAEIYVGAGVASITNANITDKRQIIKSNADLVAQQGVANGVATLDGDGKVPTSQLPEIASSTYINVKDFGAIGDGTTDDITAIQSAISYIHTSGEGCGLYFPDGAYRISASINVQIRSLRLFGSARRTGDVNDNIALGKGGAVIVPDTSASPAILLDSEYEITGFAMEDIAIARNIPITTARTGTAVEFRMKASASQFNYDFYFNRISIVNMDKCFYLNREIGATSNAHGKFTCTNSFMLWNNQIHEFTNNASWYNFTLTNNYASSNSVLPYNGSTFAYTTVNTIHVSGVNIDISKNIVESSPNVILIDNFYLGDAFNPWVKTGIIIDGNYFEGNWGAHLIRLNGCSGFYIGHNFHENMTPPSTGLVNKVKFEYCRNGVCKMEGIAQVGCVNIDNTITTDTETQVDAEDTYTYFANSDEKLILTSHTEIFGYKNSYGGATAKAILPKYGQSACNIQTITATSNDFTITVPSSATSGNWLVLTIPVMFAEKTSYPRFDLILDGAAVGSGDSKRYDFIDGILEANKWYLVTIAKKITATRTSCVLKFYPYVSSSGTKNSYYVIPTAYTTSKMRKALPWFNDTSLRFSSAPSAGAWLVGDRIYNSAPSASGYTGWICTSAGTPGTWKGFGLIQA